MGLGCQQKTVASARMVNFPALDVMETVCGTLVLKHTEWTVEIIVPSHAPNVEAPMYWRSITSSSMMFPLLGKTAVLKTTSNLLTVGDTENKPSPVRNIVPNLWKPHRMLRTVWMEEDHQEMRTETLQVLPVRRVRIALNVFGLPGIQSLIKKTNSLLPTYTNRGKPSSKKRIVKVLGPYDEEAHNEICSRKQLTLMVPCPRVLLQLKLTPNLLLRVSHG